MIHTGSLLDPGWHPWIPQLLHSAACMAHSQTATASFRRLTTVQTCLFYLEAACPEVAAINVGDRAGVQVNLALQSTANKQVTHCQGGFKGAVQRGTHSNVMSLLLFHSREPTEFVTPL
jgi:hypothetical protein